MAITYKRPEDVPTLLLCSRLEELSAAITDRGKDLEMEFAKRIPVEVNRDAQSVIAETSRRLRAQYFERTNGLLEEIDTSVAALAFAYHAEAERRIKEIGRIFQEAPAFGLFFCGDGNTVCPAVFSYCQLGAYHDATGKVSIHYQYGYHESEGKWDWSVLVPEEWLDPGTDFAALVDDLWTDSRGYEAKAKRRRLEEELANLQERARSLQEELAAEEGAL